MLNKVILIGRLVREPVIRYLSSGAMQVEFTLAYNRRYKKGEEWKEETSFFDLVAYGKLGERIADKVNKGELIVIEGRLRQERWQTESGEQRSRVRIVCEGFRIVQKKQDTYQEVQEEAIEEEDSTEGYDYIL